MDTKTLCLGVLTLGPASGYDIRRRFEDTFGHFMDVAPSAVYPALKELHRERLVSCEPVAQEGRPNKKVYGLTDAGKRAFAAALADTRPRHRVRSELILLLYFATMLSPGQLGTVFESRLTELRGWIALTEDWLESKAGREADVGQTFVARYALSVMTAESAFLSENAPQLISDIHCSAS